MLAIYAGHYLIVVDVRLLWRALASSSRMLPVKFGACSLCEAACSCGSSGQEASVSRQC